jgi:single-strand DNA-binding protein
MSVNKVILVGRVTRKPEMKYLTSGDAVTSFSLATNETWKDKNGDKQESAEFHNIVAFKKLAEIMAEYLDKGSQIYIEGKIKTRKWEDKSGVTKYTTEIIADQMKMLGGRSDGSIGSGKHEQKRESSQPANNNGFDDDFYESRIPF